jgi:hypothetical protein
VGADGSSGRGLPDHLLGFVLGLGTAQPQLRGNLPGAAALTRVTIRPDALPAKRNRSVTVYRTVRSAGPRLRGAQEATGATPSAVT